MGSSLIDDPAGWTSIQNVTNNPTTGIIHRWIVFYRQADGTEGSTTVDTKSIVYRITGHRDPAIHPPETSGVNENPSGQQTANPNPPSLSPTGGAKDYLWLAFGTWDNSGSGQTDVSSYPSNYTGGIQEGPAGGPEDSNMGVAQRERFIATPDPGPLL